MRRSRETRAYTWFHGFLRMIIGPVLVWFYRLEGENLGLLNRVRPPYLVIPNHVMTWDPLLVSYFVRQPIHFVASDANFRNSFYSWWLRRVGAIAKSKLMDDLGTLRTVMRLFKEKKVVGVFAEGQRTWDGLSQPIIPSTAKLVKVAKVPVIVPVIKGGFLSLPRYAFASRRGKVVVEYRQALTADEVRRLSVDEIRTRIEEALSHDDNEYALSVRTPYTNPRAAETLQLVLFWCPSCNALNTMHGAGRRFSCSSCGYSVRFSVFGWFSTDRTRSDPPRPRFRTIGAWEAAQRAYLESYLAERKRADASQPIFSDTPVLFSTGYRMARLNEIGTGRLVLHVDGFRFQFDDGREQFFRLGEIRALNVVYQDQLEFYYRRRLCVFQFPKHDTSGYKYLICGEMLQRD